MITVILLAKLLLVFGMLIGVAALISHADRLPGWLERALVTAAVLAWALASMKLLLDYFGV